MGVIGQKGGRKGRSGRKSKAEEMGLQALLDRCWTIPDRELCIVALADKAQAGDLEATKLLMAYAYGKPVERKEVSGLDGQPIKVIVEYVGSSDGEDN